MIEAAEKPAPRRTSAPRQAEVFHLLCEIIETKRLTVLFQPIIDLTRCSIIGFEGLVRGPSDSPLHSPLKLLRVARQAGLAFEMEQACAEVVADGFARLQLPGRLFLNISPDVLMLHHLRKNRPLGLVERAGLAPERVVFELTETETGHDYTPEMLVEVADRYRGEGFGLALDEPGEHLPRWPRLAPSFIKIGRHFIQNLDKDPVKAQFVSDILASAAQAGCGIVAEGIETHAELVTVKNLGVPFGQGYHIARPNPTPSAIVSAGIVKTLQQDTDPAAGRTSENHRSIGHKLLREVPAVQPETPNEEVYELIENDPTIDAVPVVNPDGTPVGLINRYTLIDGFSRPYRRELYGKKPCAKFMDPEPLVVDHSLSIQELSHLMVDGDRRHLANGFIITREGRYLGMGTGHDLMREITAMQIEAARYANPLTQLPGNVPINEHIEQLLKDGESFCACYCDLDHFKPFNDVYGFSRGDDIIRLTGRILQEHTDPERDFIGHIGGDDFIILFRSVDWEDRCRRALDAFGSAVAPFFSADDRDRGGYITENRRGEKEFHPLTTLSIGAVEVEKGMFTSYMEISAVAAETKKMAKRTPGNSLYINQRKYAGGQVVA